MLLNFYALCSVVVQQFESWGEAVWLDVPGDLFAVAPYTGLFFGIRKLILGVGVYIIQFVV